MRRGEIRLADLEPVRGAESNKRRPVVIVSNDGANARAESLGRGVVTVVPVTSKVTRVLPFRQFSTPTGPAWHARPKPRRNESGPLTCGASERVSDSCHQRSLWNSMTPCGCILACDESFQALNFQRP